VCVSGMLRPPLSSSISCLLIKSTMCPSETPGAIEDQQVGILWQGDYILSVSLSGAINYWDIKSARPSLVVSGHQKEASVCAT
jgi:hypothetical protein